MTAKVAPASLRDYDPNFLACRDLQHPFTIIGYHRTNDGGTRRRLRCGRCGAIGYDHLTAVGTRRKGRSYQYPDGYLIVGGVPKDTVRVEQMRRAHVYRTEDDMIAHLTPTGRARKGTKKKTHAVRHQPRNRQKVRS